MRTTSTRTLILHRYAACSVTHHPSLSCGCFLLVVTDPWVVSLTRPLHNNVLCQLGREPPHLDLDIQVVHVFCVAEKAGGRELGLGSRGTNSSQGRGVDGEHGWLADEEAERAAEARAFQVSRQTLGTLAGWGLMGVFRRE